MKKFILLFIILGLSIYANNNHNLVEIKVNAHIVLDMRYATTNNFTGKKIYSQAKCFFVREIKDKINNIIKELEPLI